MASLSRVQARTREKRRLVVLVFTILFLIACVSWVSLNHELLIPYLIGNPSPSEEAKPQDSYIRGMIYDRSYKVLAESLERVSVYALPKEVGTIGETAARLAPLLGRSRNELILQLNNNTLRIWLARDISQETEEKIRQLNLPGIFLSKESVRNYPQKESLAHTLGYVDKDMGLSGIEWHYNNLLGRYGAQLSKSEGRDDNKLVTRDEKSGFHLVLTFDLKIQRMLENALHDFVADRKDIQLAACIMEMNSGAIIASTHYPSFEPGKFSEYDKQILENILLQPMAVPEKIRRFFKDASIIQNQVEKNDTLLPWSVLSEKYDLGSQIRLWETLSLSSSLQLDFAIDDAGNMEKKPFLPLLKPQNFGAVPEVATPFQMLTGISRLLNIGRKTVPYVLGRVIERDTQNEYPFIRDRDPNEMSSISPDVSREMRRLLNVQTQSGELESAFLMGKKVSYRSVENSHQLINHKIMFTWFPPDKSDLIFMVVTKEPPCNLMKSTVSEFQELKKGLDSIFPSVIALQEVMKFNRDMMEISEKEEVNFQLVHVDEHDQKQKAPRTQIRLDGGELYMPDLLGLSLRKSLRLLQNKNVAVKIEGFGRVVEQNPVAGRSLSDIKECKLILKSDYSLSRSDTQVEN